MQSLSRSLYTVLNALRTNSCNSQRELARLTGLSLGSVNRIVQELRQNGQVHDYSLTAGGLKLLEPYKVNNAIIMAAGMSTRFAPLSYERPKGTLIVKGEILIERIIRQLQESGITDITVVVGYMKEQFLYLEDKFHVQIVVSTVYAERNNHSSLYLVREKLANTYVVAADYYFSYNVFEPYNFEGYYGVLYQEGYAKEHFVSVGNKNRIAHIQYGGSDGWYLHGHTYFDQAFSDTFKQILERTYHLAETKNKLWEDLYADHIKELDLSVRYYEKGEMYEFDSLAEVREFDEDFINNVDSAILGNIEATLQCTRNEIQDITPLEEGLTNSSFYYKVGAAAYVYRHPGLATVGLLNREVEEQAEHIARTLGLDKTFIHLCPQTGWKISHYVETTEHFDYRNPRHVQGAIKMIHQLHDSGVTVSSSFDLLDETKKIQKKMGQNAYLNFPDAKELDERAARVYAHANRLGARLVLSHNDFYDPNILVSGNELYLIDWEYSGMSDYASDLGTFICCSDYRYEEAVEVFEQYFCRPLTALELAHCTAYVSLSAYYWFIWALNKESVGESVGEYTLLWYRFAKEYGKRAEAQFAALEP